MSLITIRQAGTDSSLFNVITVAVTNVDTANKQFTCTNNTNFRRLVVGMTLFEDDSPINTTSNQIVSIDFNANLITLAETPPSATGNYKFTTATVKGTPLTNQEVDANFLELEKNKLDATGNSVITGNVEIREASDTTQPVFDTTSGNLFVSEKIIAKTLDIGGTGGTASMTTNGDIDVNNIILNGEIDDRGLFEKYLITRFNTHLLCRPYTTGETSPDLGTVNAFVIYTALFLNRIDGLSTGDIVTFGSKQATVREINSAERLIFVEESSLTMDQTYTINSTYSNNGIVYKLKKFQRGNDLLKTNQVIKIFGAGETADTIPNPPVLSKDNDLRTSGNLIYKYKALTLNRLTGKISATQAGDPIEINNGLIDTFDETTFNRLNIVKPSADSSNPAADLSVLIYRQIDDGTESDFSLVGIVDDSKFGTTQAVFNDFGDFTISDYAGRTNGSYTSVADLEYIPKKYEDRALNNHLYDSGYQYVRVNVVNADNTFTVKGLIGSSTLNLLSIDADSPAPRRDLKFYHNNSVAFDDTSNLVGGLQFLIDEKSNVGENSFTLPAGTYHTGLISLPDNFTLKGDSRFSTVLKLVPFDDYSDIRTLRGTTGANIVDGMTSDNQKSYANSLIGMTQSILTTTENNLALQNLTLDGNFNNRFFSDESTTASILGDNLVRAENVKSCLIQGVIIKNSVGGGIYAPNARKLSIENCDVIDNCTEIKDTEFYSPLYAIASQDITITTNRIRNGNSPVELSNVVRGSLVGNTIQNTDSGAITYGSVNFITTPNLILGPNNELLTTTDTLDSEFDSINIDLLQRNDGDAFESLSITFLKDGLSAYLAEANQTDNTAAAIAGTGVALNGTLFVLAKQGQFEYFIGGQEFVGGDGGTEHHIPIRNTGGVNIAATAITFPATNRAQGIIKFRMEDAQIDELKAGYSMVTGTTGGLRAKYAALNQSNRPPNETLVGLAYQVFATEYINLVNSNNHIPFTQFSRDGNSGNSIMTLASTVDLNNFIVGRKLIATSGTQTSIDSLVISGSASEAKKHLTTIDDTPSQYKELTISAVNTGTREITLTGAEITGAFEMGTSTPLAGFNVGFKNRFLIAKGRILI